MKKRLFAMILAVAMVLSVIPLASADAAFTAAGGSVTAKCAAGATVDIPVTVSVNPGITVGQIDAGWDATALKLTGVTFGVLPDNSSAKINDSTTSPYTVCFGSDDATTNFTETGVAFTMHFTVLDGATPGEKTITLDASEANFMNADWGTVPVSVTPGKVTLTGEIASPAEVAFDEPATGAAPTTALTGDNYTGTITWSPAVTGKFAASTAYTATVTLNANTGYVFKDAAAKLNGQSVTGKLNTTMTALTFIKTFPATAARTLVKLEISGTPTKTEYQYGDAFEIAGVTVTATFDNGDSEDVTGDVTVEPATFTTVTDTASVTLTYSGKSATIDGLKVGKKQIDASGEAFEYQYIVTGLSGSQTLPADKKVTYADADITVSPSAPTIDGTYSQGSGADTGKYVGSYEVEYQLVPENPNNVEVTGQPTNGSITWEIVAAEQDLTAIKTLSVRPENTLTKEQLLANIEGLKGEPTIAIEGEAYGCEINTDGSFVAGDKATSDGHDVTVKVTAAALDVNTDGKPEYLANEEGTTFTVHVQDKDPQVIGDPAETTFTYGETGATVAVSLTTGDGAITYAVTDGDAVEVDATLGALTLKKAGTATVTVTAAETEIYAETSKEIVVTVAKATQTIAPVAATINMTYGDEGVRVETTGAKTPLQYAVTAGDDVITVDENGVTTILKAGEATVEVAAVEDDCYNASTPVEVKVVVAKGTKSATETAVEIKVQKGTEGIVDLAEILAPSGSVTDIFANNTAVFAVAPEMDGTDLKFTLAGNASGAVQLRLTIDGGDCYNNYYSIVSVTITNKAIQTFDDPTTELLQHYGDTATVSTFTNAGIAIWYKLKSGADVVKMDESGNGDFTCIGIGEAVIEVSALGNAEYEPVSKEVKVISAQLPLELTALDLTSTPKTGTLSGTILPEDAGQVEFNADSVQILADNGDGTYKVGNFQLKGDKAAFYHISTESMDNVPMNQTDLVKLTIVTDNCTVDAPATATYTKGATVTLTAKPNANCKFYAWQVNGGNASASATYTFVLTGDTVVRALAVVNNGGGTSSGGGVVIPNLDLAALLTKTQVVLTIGQKEALVFGETKTNDVAPIIRNNRTMLPARFVAEALGAKVDWDNANRTVIITNGTTVIKLPIGSDTATVNGKTITLDSPAFIMNNRTYTPIRFISEALNAVVEWNNDTQQVTITKP